MNYLYASTLYPTLKAAQLASLDDWFSATGLNSLEETLDNAIDVTGYTLAQELSEVDWTILDLDVKAIADGDDFSFELDNLLEEYVTELRARLDSE